MKAELLIPTRAELGEGMNLFPDGAMRWVDLPNGIAYRWDGNENKVAFNFPHEISKILPWHNGTIVLDHTAVLFLDDTGQECERIELHTANTNLRCSDGLVLPNGELLFGILDRDLTPHRGRLVRVRRNRTIETIVDKTSISNGITLLPGGERIAWVDSVTKKIEVFAFDLDSGAIEARSDYAQLEIENGLIDGMCADSEGGIWAALWKGSGVAHFWPDGSFDTVIEFDSPNVTSCAFDSENNLLLTTGTATLSTEELRRFPGAGGVWKIEPQEHGATGLPLQISNL